MRIKTFLNVIHNSRGLTLVEMLAVLAIMSTVIGLIWTIVFQVSTQSETTAYHTQLKQEANIIISELKQQHQAEEAILCYEDGQLRDGDVPLHDERYSLENIRIDTAGMTLEEEGKCFDTPLDNAEAVDISFTLRSNDSNQGLTYDVDTALYPDSTADEITPPEDLPSQNGNGDSSFADIVREDDLFTVANQFKLTGSSTITGREGTVVIQEEYHGTNASITMIEAAEIYIDAPEIEMPNHALGNEEGPMSELYIRGNIDITGGNARRPRLLGNLFLDGTLEVSSWMDREDIVTGTITESSEISFPVNDTGRFRSETWYDDYDYSDVAINNGNQRYLGSDVTISDDGNAVYEDIHAVSTGDITLADNVAVDGILYAPNGSVSITGSSSFEGIIIADLISVEGNSHVQFTEPASEADLPFR
ncbi:PulJ/GspJ family protein [Salisediminibacterium halotolerans]|uniref:Prepilin-type N-terminal cleavage/methylation domain-containing protein n=1 Tax=Salisediminibacterium halotolerans TaxID=517425 RepID=A0A1H9TUY3_9BACI|nr:prepilin-type N-terminal cleavage/methylation domain-containing protein [Salisediminibacterium haloalkalitolerans]SES00909.1 prepilin-type N-terminal cleavage/methylation domain-containing protein [Salisediminibacterium haloalkalitolerans]